MEELLAQQAKKCERADSLTKAIREHSRTEEADLMSIIRRVPRIGGIDYEEQTEMLESMNGALVAMMQGV